MKRTLPIIIISICLSCLFSVMGISQDLHFSQFQTAPLWSNPAFTGDFGGDMRFIANYRNQWQALPAPYNTGIFSVDTKVQVPNSFSHFGIGAVVYKDQAGDLGFHTTSAQLSLAYNMYLGSSRKSDFYVYAGAQYGRIRQGYDISKAHLENAGQEIDWAGSIGYNDVAAGIAGVWVMPHAFFYGGAAISHFNNPTVSFSLQKVDQLPQDENVFLSPKLDIHLAGNISLANQQVSLLPVVQYLHQQDHAAWIFGADLMFNNLRQKYFNTTLDWTVGVHHRLQDAFIVSTKFRLSEQYNFGISYDLPVSKIQNPSNAYGAVEIFISVTIPRKLKQGDSPRQGGGIINIKCPSAGARPNEKNPWYRDNGVGF